MSDTPLLQVKNVNKLYKIDGQEIYALRNVSLDIYKGELVSILGKSGSGKSTLMHIIGLLDTPTSGSVLLHNKEVGKLNENQLARIRNEEIGFVFQSFNLLQRATVMENVLLPLQYSNTPKSQRTKKVEEILKKVELTERKLNKSNELSGGQKQRVAIARALINEPSIILADEPTGNLDSKTGDEIFKIFQQLNEQGKTIIIVTHDEDLAKQTKRKILIKDGEIIS